MAVEVYFVRVEDLQVEDEVHGLDELAVYALPNLVVLYVPSVDEDYAGCLARLVVREEESELSLRRLTVNLVLYVWI